MIFTGSLKRKEKCSCTVVRLSCPDIGRNADDWAVVSVSELYDASAAAYAGKTRFRM